MNRKEMEDQVIQSYQQDEQMMILVFAQWCINHDLDPADLYKEAYPEQADNESLIQALQLTVSKQEAGEIPDETLLGVLSLFGNDDLAFVVTKYMDNQK
ncbi:hypothetical protein [Halobacillus naozhouensis]|uniref:YxiS n=1 Tax=Halobacillus naozhouensis TaxID=554880 RepID=A0ABY8J1I1_9BACI|nr:hypothetical protein [Halobacillus naozhouensis]WFT74846.1 hypothetical protein P9989_21365 [Halobacillus naozhouensis]